MVKSSRILPPPGTCQASDSPQLTDAQRQKIETIITPQLEQLIQNHGQSATGRFRSWQDLLSSRFSTESADAARFSAASPESSSTTVIHFTDPSGSALAASATTWQYHPATADTVSKPQAVQNHVQPSICCSPIGPPPDLDNDGLPDNPTLFSPGGGFNGDLESALAKAFMPVYFISTGEQQQFATFGDYVPWTVVNPVGTNPPNSYYRVSPLGLGTDSSGNQVYAVRVDYLSLWNADGGLVGGGAACLYSYVGLDNVIYQLLDHDLDAERSVMLLAAPAVNGNYNPDPNAYSLYTLYTGAHEGTFFDQSGYASFWTPVPSGNHVNLYQSLSKHSTYGFNPDYYTMTPWWFVDSTNAAITAAYFDGDIDDYTYAFLIAVANDVFYGCLVEKFGYQGGAAPNPVSNVGEVAHPLNGNGFIRDNSARALNLSDKLTDRIF